MNWLRRWSAPTLFVILSLTGLVACGRMPPAAAEGAKPQAEDKWLLDRSLTLAPQPEPRPALEYRLFPLASDRKDGNAVPIYLRLNFEQSDAARRDWTETPGKWNTMPIDKIPLDEAKAYLNSYPKRFLPQFELGARRKTADWNYTLDQGNVMEIFLPDLQMMRSYVPMMELKVRVELAEGDYPAAAHWLETGFAFSQHVGNGPFLISRLVGVICANQFADCLLDFVQLSDAPNLYWSLTALPRPLIDLRDAEDFEYRFMELQFPELADLDRPRAPEQWDVVLKKVRTEYRRLTLMYQRLTRMDQELYEGRRLKAPPGTTAADLASKSPDLLAARKYLTGRMKLAPDNVEAMPPAQVLLLYLVDSYNEFRDDFYKGTYLPYPEARRFYTEAETRRKAAPDTEGKRFADALLPAFGTVQRAQTRLDRKIAALRVIEALRMHAAAHDGALPDKLSEVTIVPIPDDPGTGKPFEYQRDGDGATLISRIPNEKPSATGLRYRLVMKKK
jgi:hypothetical protein